MCILSCDRRGTDAIDESLARFWGQRALLSRIFAGHRQCRRPFRGVFGSGILQTKALLPATALQTMQPANNPTNIIEQRKTTEAQRPWTYIVGLVAKALPQGGCSLVRGGSVEVLTLCKPELA